MVKRLSLLLFWLAFSMVMLFLWGHMVVVSAKSGNGAGKLSRPSHPVWAATDDLKLTNTNTYTIYLPVVVKPYVNAKKGLGVKAPPACTDMESLAAGWYLTWGPWPDTTCPDSYKARFVPRISRRSMMPDLLTAVLNAEASGWLIGFGEPNRIDKDNMSPSEGAQLWREFEFAAEINGSKLVSPSPYEPNPTFGKNWLWDMVDAYYAQYGQYPRFDATGWNIYGCTNDPNCHDVYEMRTYLINRHLEALMRGYNGQIWVLEYGGCLTSNSSESDKTIMREMTDWFNQVDWIERYAWYSNRLSSSYQGTHNCVLVNDNGSLTALGEIYRDY